MKKLKYEILFTILFMTIGIAAVTGNLFISGSTELAANTDDFDVYFSDVISDKPDTYVSINTSKSFEVSTTLQELNEEDKVNFKITNASQNYDAEVSIDCTSESPYLRVIPHLSNNVVPARSEIDGYVTIKLIKQVIDDEQEQNVSCSITASAVEKTTLSTGTDYTDKPTMLITASQRNRLPFEEGTFEEFKYNYIRTITFEDEINIPDDAIEVWDFGVAQNGDVMAYIVENEDWGYDLYIQSNEQLYANPNMSYWFSDIYYLETINNLTLLDTSNVTNMSYMFANASSLTTLDVSNFNTSNVTDMSYMFYENYITTLNLSSFDTSSVTDMSHMFEYSYNLYELDISNWDTSNVTNMAVMFSDMYSLTTLDLSEFNTKEVTNMNCMFCYSDLLENLNLAGWDTGNVTSMSYMFSGTSITTLDLSNFDTSNVTNMSSMFAYTHLTTLDLSSFDTSNVTSMSSMFSGTSITTLDLSNFDTSKVIDMSYMFYETSITTLDLSSFDTSNVTSMSSMFSETTLTTLDLSSFDTSNVTSMSSMFSGTSLTTLDLSSFDTSNVTNMSSMFYNSPNIKTTINIKNPNVTSYSNMFKNTATGAGAGITVNYISETSTLVDNMIATKSNNSNVVKGNLIQ